MALWLAAQGWQVTALELSATGLAKGRSLAPELGLRVDWRLADATTADLGVAAYDLVMVLHLHLHQQPAPRGRRPAGQRCAVRHDTALPTRGPAGTAP